MTTMLDGLVTMHQRSDGFIAQLTVNPEQSDTASSEVDACQKLIDRMLLANIDIFTGQKRAFDDMFFSVFKEYVASMLGYMLLLFGLADVGNQGKESWQQEIVKSKHQLLQIVGDAQINTYVTIARNQATLAMNTVIRGGA